MPRCNDFIKETNKAIGQEIYALRLAKGLSRTQFVENIDVTQQQLQKYESGINVIPLGRLAVIADALGVDIGHFLVNLEPKEQKIILVTQHQRMCMEISRNFMKISNEHHQKAIHLLVKSLCDKNETAVNDQ
jgi:transcriptional regulator with XRE-family HTH domain